MAITVVEKRKGTRTCGDCGDEVAVGITKCECGSENIKKSLVVVRKAVGDEDDDLETAAASSEVEEDEEEEDEDLDSLEDDDDEDDEEDDEEDEDEDEEDDEDDDTPPAGVKKANIPLLGLEALNISTAAAEDIVKVFADGGNREAYEEVMVEFNNIMDSAAEKWFGGSVVSKAGDSAGHAALIRERVNGIISKEKTMARPKNFDNLDPETKKYIEELEGSEDAVTKSISKRDDLPEDVRKSLEAADRIVEERETEKWNGIAKGYSHFPGDKVELAKTLRKLHTADPEAFEELKKSLDAAEYNLSQSDIFKSYGQPGGGEPTDEISKRRKAAEELVAKGEFATVEQAEVSLMSGADYTPTNAQ